MRRIPQAIYQTADQIEEDIRQREVDARRLSPDTDDHREIMKEIAQLRIYADAKRWLSAPTKQRA